MTEVEIDDATITDKELIKAVQQVLDIIKTNNKKDIKNNDGFNFKPKPRGILTLYNTPEEYKESLRHYRRKHYMKNQEQIIEQTKNYV